ncbi:DnaJ-class molecular chaperone [Rhizobium sp. SG_E_25_P2]|uniref:DnaJ C-terminal domain-containing protein n=1 Tax=Rhizobium sp. SG_E_25_P2 TaxID=2879942 RepID=UPI002473A327|nr:DnaJ C-terminal domain-containing protein [Rhizobium sp. SG_E_25_P2]MDH6266583.1 DnaJ-class molecular chaperone [Rhizobium sp. SG_E_25_P2]
MRDPYSVLGVSRNADQNEIKAAWRAAAKALHPDQNPDDPTATSRFSEVGRAYDILRDPEKRRRFDQARARSSGQTTASKEKTFMEQRAERARMEAEARAARARAAAAAAAVEAEQAQKGAEKHESAEDVLAKMFGGKKGPEQPASAGDKKADPRVEPKTEPRAEARTEQRAATRAQPNAEPEPEGGEIKVSPALDLISYVFKRLIRPATAPERAPDLVLDAPVSIEDLLKRLNPTVTLPDGKMISIPLPENAHDGSVVRVEGYGHRLPGMKRGDVVATLRIKPHKWFRWDGGDLLTYVDIDIENAVLGCEATVTTPDGEAKVTIPPWSGSQYRARIAGKGLPISKDKRGDLIAEVRVLLWDHPDQKVIDLMRSMKNGLYL